MEETAADLDRLLNPFRYDADGRLTEVARRGEAGGSARPPGRSLVLEVEAFHRRQGFFADVLAAFRETVVLAPVREERLVAAERDGVRWLLAFSDETALAAYLTERQERAEPVPYLRVTGARLLDAAVPRAGGPAGVALDIAGDRPVLFPPVRGIVPDDAAVV